VKGLAFVLAALVGALVAVGAVQLFDTGASAPVKPIELRQEPDPRRAERPERERERPATAPNREQPPVPPPPPEPAPPSPPPPPPPPSDDDDDNGEDDDDASDDGGSDD
jgi:hypothetical protein